MPLGTPAPGSLLELENLAVYCRASEGLGVGGLVDATPQNPQTCKILWRSGEKCRRYPRSRICASRKSGMKFGMMGGLRGSIP